MRWMKRNAKKKRGVVLTCSHVTAIETWPSLEQSDKQQQNSQIETEIHLFNVVIRLNLLIDDSFAPDGHWLACVQTWTSVLLEYHLINMLKGRMFSSCLFYCIHQIGQVEGLFSFPSGLLLVMTLPDISEQNPRGTIQKINVITWIFQIVPQGCIQKSHVQIFS